MATSAVARQKQPTRKPAMRVSAHGLRQAFECFTQATGSLKTSCRQLQVEMMRLRRKLEVTNQELFRSLEENGRIRTCLSRTLEGLPLGVLVFFNLARQGWNS
jgi:hypothetical protein